MLERFKTYIEELDDRYINKQITKPTYLSCARNYAKKIAKEHSFREFNKNSFVCRQDIHRNIKAIYVQFPHLLVGNIDNYLNKLMDFSYKESELIDTAKKWIAVININEQYENILNRTEKMIQSFTHNQIVTDKIMFRVVTELN